MCVRCKGRMFLFEMFVTTAPAGSVAISILTLLQIYSNRSVSEARKNQELPPTPTEAPAVGAVFSPPIQETRIIPEIAPMRRGRPTRPQSSAPSSAKPSPSPYRSGASKSSSNNDPFAALDGGGARAKKTADELSNRFPSLDQFDILHEKGDKFNFEPTVQESKSEDDDLSKRLTNALADDAFARRLSPERQESAVPRRSHASPVRSSIQEVPIRQSTPLYQPIPKRPVMVSTGTMTSPTQTPRLPEQKPSSRPIYRFPPSDQERSSSQPWAEEEQRKPAAHRAHSPPSTLQPEASPRLSSDRVSSQSSSARPSMEALRRQSTMEIGDPIGRSKSAIAKGRPVSVQPGTRYELPHDSEDFPSSLDIARAQYEGGAPLRSVHTEAEYDRANISSDIDYLRAKEEEESNRKREKRSSAGSKHTKRASLSALSLSGGKTLLAGRFGEAFRRFEASNPDKPSTPSAEYSPQQESLINNSDDMDSPDQGLSSYEDDVLEDVDRDDISPEMRRELERRRLSQEEKRVVNAAAEYRRRVADDGGKAGADTQRSRAIQSRVQNLLGESHKPPTPKTASGYGKYTEETALPAKQSDAPAPRSATLPISRTPGPVYGTRQGTVVPPDRREGASAPAGLVTSSAGYSSGSRPVARPAAPPKPKNLRVTQDGPRPGSSTSQERSPSLQQTQTPTSVGEDWETNFSRRFPSLSGLEMETEIEIPKYPKLRTREV